MATRMQQRRGTAAQWTSANPVLNAGELGWESDTNKFKIGDGTNHWADLDYFIDQSSTVNPSFGSSITFEGATADSYETTLQVTDPTADRTITFPDATGTVALTSDIAELSQDAIDTALTAGTGITKTYNDAANTLTLAVDTTTIQARVADVSDTEIGYLNGVTSAIQTQLDAKSTASKTETLSNKSISLTSNTLTGTTAEFNTALSDSNFVTTGDTGTVTSTMLADGTIVDGDINASAAIAQSKIANLTTDLAAKASLSGATFTGAVSGTDLTLSGNLTVNGTTTNINSTNLVVEDKNVVLGDTTTPTDTTADGGGITLKGTTDKTFNWVDATDSWTSSEHVNLASGKELKIAGTSVLSGSTLGSGVTGSSLTSVGTISSGTWNGTAIAVANGGTGSTSAGDARTALGLAIGTDVQAYNSTLAAVAGGTYTGDDSIATVGTITAGTWNGTAIAIANGGTGSTTNSGARTALGLAIGTDIQAYNSTLAAVAGGTYTGDDSITTVGTIGTGTWNGTAIGIAYGGTGQTTASAAANALLPSQTSNSGKYLTTDGSSLSWATVAGGISASSTDTLTNKSISLTTNTLTGTVAEFNAALTDADFATLDGIQTFTNKTLTSPKINENVALTATATELNYVDGVTSAIQTQLDAKATYTSAINSQSGTTYTLALDDHKQTVLCTSSSAVTVTIPQESSVAWPTGSVVTIVQNGTGQVTVAAGAGVTLNTQGGSGARKTRYQHQMASLYKTGTNTWMVTGDLIVP